MGDQGDCDQICFIVFSWLKALGTFFDGLFAQYQFVPFAGFARIRLPGIWR